MSNSVPETDAIRDFSAILPTELWLNILEQTSIITGQHLWTVIRHISHSFKQLAERAFVSKHLPRFAISLSLPRRDPLSSALLWPGAIPHAQLVLNFDCIAQSQACAIFVSSSTIGEGAEVTSLEDLRASSVLPKERLLAAPVWVFMNTNQMAGLHLDIPKNLAWYYGRRCWGWEVEWKSMLDRFYGAKTRTPRAWRKRQL